MEQFSLEKYLENQSRKVVTRDGREVEIVKYDMKGTNFPVLYVISNEDGSQEPCYCSKSGMCQFDNIQSSTDLFFADEEEELTKFEKAVKQVMWTAYNYDDCSNGKDVDDISNVKATSKTLLDLARKELQPEIDKEIAKAYKNIDTIVYDNGYKQGQYEIIEDLPKWKKATEQKDLEKHIAILEENKVLLSNYLEEGDYYIDLEDLKTLPKEE